MAGMNCLRATEGLRATDELRATDDVLPLLRLRAQLKQQATEYSSALRAELFEKNGELIEIVNLQDCEKTLKEKGFHKEPTVRSVVSLAVEEMMRHGGQECYPEGITEENFIMKATQDLERDLEKIKISYQNKALALQRIQTVSALRNQVKQNNDDSRVIVETLKCIVMLSKAVIECQQQVHEKEQKLIDLRKRRLSLKKNGEEKLLQVHTLMKKTKEEQEHMAMDRMLEKMHNNLQRERHMTTIIQNVFQNIIMASRVNWAEDPSLKAVVLNLEKMPVFCESGEMPRPKSLFSSEKQQ